MKKAAVWISILLLAGGLQRHAESAAQGVHLGGHGRHLGRRPRRAGRIGLADVFLRPEMDGRGRERGHRRPLRGGRHRNRSQRFPRRHAQHPRLRTSIPGQSDQRVAQAAADDAGDRRHVRRLHLCRLSRPGRDRGRPFSIIRSRAARSGPCEINGRELPELGINAAIAGYYKVPVVMLSGDTATCRQGPDLSASRSSRRRSRKAIGRFAARSSCLQLEARQRLKDAAREALLKRDKIPVFKMNPPFELRAQLPQQRPGGDAAPPAHGQEKRRARRGLHFRRFHRGRQAPAGDYRPGRSAIGFWNSTRAGMARTPEIPG